MGFSPDSFIHQYGIFKQIPNLEPIVGLQATKAEGQIIIGGYDKDIVKDLNNVQWLQSSNETNGKSLYLE